MRKTILLAALLVAAWAAVPASLARAQALTPEEKTFFDKHTADVLKTEITRMTDAALAKVFATPFYKLKVDMKDDGGGFMMSGIDATLARAGDKLVNVSAPTTDGDVPEMVKMLDPKFKLSADADAAALQKCLDILYPPFGDEDKKEIKFKHAGNEWTFIRGKFFESFKGYVITTNADGSVKSVKFMLKLP